MLYILTNQDASKRKRKRMNHSSHFDLKAEENDSWNTIQNQDCFDFKFLLSKVLGNKRKAKDDFTGVVHFTSFTIPHYKIKEEQVDIRN